MNAGKVGDEAGRVAEGKMLEMLGQSIWTVFCKQWGAMDRF